MSSKFLRIGVTGSIGSGKSEVCKIFERLGVPVLYADDIAKRLSDSDLSIKKKIVKLLGPNSYTPKGLLDRRFVSKKIFSDQKVYQAVNRIIHPKVREEVLKFFTLHKNDRQMLVVVEAALIFEAELDKNLDYVIVVDANKDVRLSRMRTRNKSLYADFRQRQKFQWSSAKKRQLADFIIINNGSKSDLKSKVKFFFQLFQGLSQRDRK